MSDVLFIHGLWVTPTCFDRFMGRARDRGITASAPAWPQLDRPVAELRADPPPGLARVGIAELVDHYAALVRAAATPPVLVGHSLGGLVVLRLLDAGLGRAGVVLDGAPVRGIPPTRRALLSGLPVVSKPFGWRRLHRMSRSAFAANFANALPADEQDAAFAEHIIPAPGRPIFQLAFSMANPHSVVRPGPGSPPVLFVAGTADRTADPRLVRATHAKYLAAGAPVELLEAVGHSHWLIAEPGWEKIADAVLDFVEKI